jgi:hypothetical protein
MNNLEIHRKLKGFTFIYNSADTKELEFDSESKLKSFLDDLSIPSEPRGGKIYVKRSDLTYTYYEDLEEFYAECKRTDFDGDIIIDKVSEKNDSCEYLNEITYIQGEGLNEDFLFKNALAYFEAKAFFKDIHQKSENDFEFVDFYSEASKSIVLASLSDQRRLKIGFKSAGCINLDRNIDYYSKFLKFKDEYEQNSRQFPLFLKNSVISNLMNEPEDKFELFFKQIDKILTDARINFNVYLQGLSLDKIKTEYKEYKEKYFSSQNNILNKVSTQILALPITIASSAFAIYELKNEFFALVLICLGLSAFIIYISYLIKMYWNDLYDVNREMTYDYNLLESMEFFKVHKEELNHFKIIKNSLDIRIKNLKLGLRIFNLLVWVFSIGLIIYAMNLLNGDITIIQNALIIVPLLAILVIVDVYVIFTANNEGNE